MEAASPFTSALIDSARRAWAAGSVVRMRERHPGLVESFGGAGFHDLQSHCEGLLDHLSTALWCGEPALFDAQVRWIQTAFEARGVPLDALRASLACLRDELGQGLPRNAAQAAVAVLERALIETSSPAGPIASALAGDGRAVVLARRYLCAALEGRRRDAIDVALQALDEGMSVGAVYRDVLARAQHEVGRMWQEGEIGVSEEHFVSRVTEQVLAFVNARMPREPRNGKRVLVTSANGDLHDIGLRMIADHFEMAGFDPIYLGASTPADDVVRAAIDFEVDLAAIAAKLTLHVRATAELVRALRGEPRTRALPILVGGPPFEIAPRLWKTIGADGCAHSAEEAVEVGKRLVVARS